MRTAADGSGSVVDQVRLEILTTGPTRTITSIDSAPPMPAVQGLVGANVAPGFRKVVATTMSGIDGSVLGLLLDDLPGAALVSGSARIRAEIASTGALPSALAGHLGDRPMICIGWQHGGVMQQRALAGDPLLGQGPPAGDLQRPDDPFAWPDQPALPPHGMRRLRRIDVRVSGAEVVAETHFRDSHVDAAGAETAVHEYEVAATAPLDSLVVATVQVGARVLPGPDCPGAVASAQRIVGEPLMTLRDLVRNELRGDTICTHLNDQLRSLADVPALLRLLEPGRLTSDQGDRPKHPSG
ncbi:MAG: DUF2889 domain-containing protein [Acidimicrobiales bacterium]